LKWVSCSGGHPPRNTGKIVSGKNGRTIAQQYPALDYGALVEVRPVADLCSVRARATEDGLITSDLYRSTVGAA
jgi:hypothetical protein